MKAMTHDRIRKIVNRLSDDQIDNMNSRLKALVKKHIPMRVLKAASKKSQHHMANKIARFTNAAFS